MEAVSDFGRAYAAGKREGHLDDAWKRALDQAARNAEARPGCSPCRAAAIEKARADVLAAETWLNALLEEPALPPAPAVIPEPLRGQWSTAWKSLHLGLSMRAIRDAKWKLAEAKAHLLSLEDWGAVVGVPGRRPGMSRMKYQDFKRATNQESLWDKPWTWVGIGFAVGAGHEILKLAARGP